MDESIKYKYLILKIELKKIYNKIYISNKKNTNICSSLADNFLIDKDFICKEEINSINLKNKKILNEINNIIAQIDNF